MNPLISSTSTFFSVVIDSPSLQRKSEPPITFLFNETILKLSQQLNSLMLESPGEYVAKSEKIVQESCFYSLLKRANLQQVPLKMDILLLTILELNEYCIHTPEDEETLINAIMVCFRLLSKEEGWKPTDTTIFFEKLYHLHNLYYGNKDITPVLVLCDGGPAAGYLSPKSQKFMDEVTYDEQFEPITKCLMKVNGDITGEKTQIAIAQIADKFFTKAVKISYLVMSRNIYSFPIINRATALTGMGQFRQITIRTKYMYMWALREQHLACIAQAKRNPSTTKISMKVIEKKAAISNQMHVVSFAVVSEQEKMTIKAITVSCDHPPDSTRDSNLNNLETTSQEVYFFVQEFREESPEVHPDPAIPFSERPLYKFELIPHSHNIRLQKASEEMRKLIINLIGEIQDEVNEETKSKIAVECAVHTAIWHQEELMLVEIIRQIGSMLSSRALYGAIKTYVKYLPQPSEGRLSNQIHFQNFKRQLQQVLVTVYVMVTNKYLSSLYQDDIIKPLLAESSPPIREAIDKSMEQLKERTWQVFNNHKHPGKWLLKAIMSSGYDGDLATLSPLIADHVNETYKPTLHFEECKTLLNTALKTQEEQVVLSLVKAMVMGILAIMKGSKEKNAIDNLIKYFGPVENFPLEIIPDIMKAHETPQQKASRLFYILFSQKSLGLAATEEQHMSIKAFLKLNG